MRQMETVSIDVIFLCVLTRVGATRGRKIIASIRTAIAHTVLLFFHQIYIKLRNDSESQNHHQSSRVGKLLKRKMTVHIS